MTGNQAASQAWRNRRLRLSVIAAAVVLAAGIGFGVGRAVGLGNTVILTAIPRESSYHVPGQVYDTAIGTTGGQDALTIDVGTLAALDTTVRVGRTTRSGLMASVLQSAQTSAIGGPLVNLNGQVIGIIVGGSGSGLQIIGYAIPINTALAVATQIADGNS